MKVRSGSGDMTRVSIIGHPLTATAALVWNGAERISGRTPPAQAAGTSPAWQRPAAGAAALSGPGAASMLID